MHDRKRRVATIKDQMIEAIRQFLDGFPPEIVVLVISMFPILELRGGLPLAIREFDMSFGQAYIYSVIGNMAPVLPLLLLFQPISKILMRYQWYEKFYNWLYNRTMKKSQKVEKYGAIALILFTAVPLPTTGAWTACAAACFLNIRIKFAFTAIFIGVLIAGLVVGVFSESFLRGG